MPSSPPTRSCCWFLIHSPFGVITLGQILGGGRASALGSSDWLPFIVCCGLTLGVLVAIAGGSESLKKWLRPPEGAAHCLLLALAVSVLLTLPMLIPNWRLLLTAGVLMWTAFFVLINPAIEGLYWRGAPLDATSLRPRGAQGSYSTALFAFTFCSSGRLRLRDGIRLHWRGPF